MEIISAVVWADRSKSDLKRIFNFNKELHGFDKASKIINNLIDDAEAELLGKLGVFARDQEFIH
jgi:plasmid stabilization system protein ParE